ncbi:hypothetical protein HPB49_016372 [Dermacentor silvarum]|uniref:Uncharacterized protein n=1 Tax=Dermacentor silvarum TaxID=543639 RepID=A0ACB8DEM7_DERSI|nr:hypothetical protein HPB49_016372 [Dermacentor silvarum]
MAVRWPSLARPAGQVKHAAGPAAECGGEGEGGTGDDEWGHARHDPEGTRAERGVAVKRKLTRQPRRSLGKSGVRLTRFAAAPLEGLKDTLAKMDKEFPRNEGCFTARDQLIKAAFMERLVRDNKARDSPFRALLEMLIYERLQKKSVKSKHGSKVNLVPSAGDSARHVEMNIRNNNCIPVALKEAKSESSDSLSSLEGALPVRTVADTDRPQSARGRREPGGFIVRRPARSDIESVHRLISKSQQYRGPTRVTNSAIQRMEEALKHEPGVHDGEGDRIDADHLLEKYGG